LVVVEAASYDTPRPRTKGEKENAMFKTAALITIMLLSPLARAAEPIEITSGVLQLSEDQTHALVTMVQSRNEALRPLFENLQSDQQSLARLLETSNDATAIGQLLLQIHAEQQHVAEIARNASSAVRK